MGVVVTNNWGKRTIYENTKRMGELDLSGQCLYFGLPIVFNSHILLVKNKFELIYIIFIFIRVQKL